MRCSRCDGYGMEATGPGPNDYDNCMECGGFGHVYNPESPTNRDYERHRADEYESTLY